MSTSPTEARPVPLRPLGGASGTEQICARFLHHASSHGSAVALRTTKRTWSYAELAQLSGQLAKRIQTVLPQPSSRAGLYTGRSPAFVIGLLGALRAGRPVVLLDSHYPATKIHQQIQHAQLALLLHEETLTESASACRLACPGLALLPITADGSGGLPVAPAAEATPSNAGQAAYLLFTSGTTAGPRLIAAGHAPLVHFIEFYAETFAPERGTRFSLLSGLGHDPVLRDVFVPLSTGGELCIPPQATLTDPRALHDWVADMRIAYMHATPPMQFVLELGARGYRPLLTLRYLFSGGDKLKARHREVLARIAPHCQMINFYGATETPQAVAWHAPSAQERDPIAIGKGIADTQLLVLDDALAICDVGVEGQIAVRSHYQSLSETLMTLPADPGATAVPVYLTGDFGYVRADGAVVLVGRRDDQVKIRAFRIDLNEIVESLESLDGIALATVLVLENTVGESQLIACVQVSPPYAYTDVDLRARLGAVLPAHMVPSQYRFHAQLPLLPNGKIDRQALRRDVETLTVLSAGAGAGTGTAADASGGASPGLDVPVPDDTEHGAGAAQAGATERAIARAWQRLLLIEQVPPEATFATLGGDSLSFIQASMDLELILGHLPPRWETLTVRELAYRRSAQTVATRSVDSTVWVRALSITLIVLGHTDFLIIEGTTTTLFVIAGMSFGRYQLPAVLQQDSIRPILRTMLSVAIPALIWKVCLVPSHPTPHWQTFVFIANLVSPELDAGLNNWFVDVFLQILLFLAVVFSCEPVRRLMHRNPYALALAATYGAVLGAGVIHRIWDTAYLADWVPHLKLWLVVGGVTLLYVERGLQYLPLLLLLALGAWFNQFTLFSLSCLLLVSQTRRLPVPFGTARVINEIASASLIIYLTHNEVRHRLLAIWPDLSLPLSILACLAFGILVNLVWTRAYRQLQSLVLRVHSVSA